MCKIQIKKYRAILILRNSYHKYNSKIKLNVKKIKKIFLENEIFEN